MQKNIHNIISNIANPSAEYSLLFHATYIRKLCALKAKMSNYQFDYTGSNNWVGAPKEISSDLTNPMNAQMFTPLKNAHDIYLTFNVEF